MRSIIATIDHTPSSITAQALALSLARQAGARLHGIAAIEVSDLDRAEAFPVGSAEFALTRLKNRQQQSTERRARLADLTSAFQHSTARKEIEAECSTIEGDVRGELLRAIETCDLVVTGCDVEFHLDPMDGVTPLVEHMIARGSRPVVVTGPSVAADGPVLVAYDGSAAAAKSLQIATILGMFGTSQVHVLTILPDRNKALDVASRARRFLAPHQVECEVEASTSSAEPAKIILKRAEEIGARLLVMGAFGHRGLREIVFGSSTRRIFDSAALPLFIYH